VTAAAGDDAARPIDPDATAETLALHRALSALAGRRTLFGHQDDLAYGTAWWAEPGRSDVAEATGSYPSVLGFDLGHLETGAAANLDGVAFEDITRWVREGHAAGALVTLSWHSVNPVTGGGYGENTTPRAIASVLPGGEHHDRFRGWLDALAGFLAGLVDASGTPIPVVFRPYHEHSGDWFWWCLGGDLNSEDDFVALWRLTVDHLRAAGVHHLLWAISPDRSRLDVDDLATTYLRGYPGDDAVDVLGVDDYWDAGHGSNDLPLEEQHEHYVRTLRAVSRLAAERGKLAALTETGTVPGDDPFTGHLLRALTADEHTRRILWSLVWRNAQGDEQSPGTPAAGTAAARDLAAFRADPFVLFADDADLYGRSTGA